MGYVDIRVITYVGAATCVLQLCESTQLIGSSARVGSPRPGGTLHSGLWRSWKHERLYVRELVRGERERELDYLCKRYIYSILLSESIVGKNLLLLLKHK